MDLDPLQVNVEALALNQWGDSKTRTLEQLSNIWSAAEALTNPDILARRAGFERLVSMEAVRLSPLVVYLVASRLSDPDIEFRAQVTQALSAVFRLDRDGQAAPEVVRTTLATALGQMLPHTVYALLQASEAYPEARDSIAVLFNASPYAGLHLGDILTDRKNPLDIRKQAAYYIGEVGFLNALPQLERLLSRLESRNGYKAFSFGSENVEETCLLPVVRTTLDLLRAP